MPWRQAHKHKPFSGVERNRDLDQGRDVVIGKGLIQLGWFFFKWGILPGAIATIVALPYVYRQVDEGIRGQIRSRIAEHYAGLNVTVRSAVRIEGRGIEVHGLSISEPGAEDPREAIVHLEEMTLCCTTELADLLTEEVMVGRIVIRRPTLRIVRRPDGTWNTDRLFPLPKLSSRAPEVVIDSGTIEILDPTRNPPARFVLPDVNFTITPDETAGPGGRVRKLHGTLTGNHLRRIEVEGTINTDGPSWSIAGRIEDLMISPDLCDALPAPVAGPLADFRGFRGRAGATFRLSNAPSPGQPYRFDVSAAITQGRLDDPRLPFPLMGIVATVQANNDGFAIRDLSAQGGEGTLWLDGRRAGYGADSPWTLRAALRRLELNSQLLAVLPENMRTLWRKYSPSGLIDANVALASDGVQLQPEATEVTVRCLDVGFAYHVFPYRLERAQGELVLKNDVLTVDGMTAHAGPRPIRIKARIEHPLRGPVGWLEAEGQAIPIDLKDQNLVGALGALNESSRQAVEALAPRGTCDFRLRVQRDQPGAPPTQHFVLGLNDCSICFAGFPYPLENVRGLIERFPDRSWAFTDLAGTNDTAQVTLAGHLTESPEGRTLSLRLDGKDVPLEEELRDALRSEAMRQVWNDMKPRGLVDLGADIQWLVDQHKVNLKVVAKPQPETASIEPKAFPYRMEKLRGAFVYQDGRVSFDRLQAEHGQVTLSCNGACNFGFDGGWRLRLSDIAVDCLRLDRELIQALPARLRKGLVRLNPRGPMDLHRSSFDLWHTGVADDPVHAEWDLAIGFQQASIDCGVLLENLHGDLTLAGKFDERGFHSGGELAIESLTFKGFQFTQVMGPIWIDDGRVLFGSWVDLRGGSANKSGSPRPITARFLDGAVQGDAWIALEEVPRYDLTAQLTQANLSLLAKETMAGQQNIGGRLGAEIELRGRGATVHGLSGAGRIWLREADVYELPVMISLLKILSIREPSRTAFSSADIRFNISGPHVYLRPIKFEGDAISLLGQGQMDFDSKIDLAFYAVVGRDLIRLPFVSPIMDEASRRTMMINVVGTLQNPQTSQQVLPGVKEALARLQADLQPDAAPPSPTTGPSPPEKPARSFFRR